MDPATTEITAGVDLHITQTKLHAVRGAELISNDDSDVADLKDLPSLRQPVRLRVTHRSRESSIELQCPPPGPIRARCRFFRDQYGLRIRGIADTRHDDALRQLVDLSTSFFLDLDIDCGLTVRLKKNPSIEFSDIEDYDNEEPNETAPRFPIVRYNHDAASLYLYARTLIRTPSLEYLAYYQVIEFHMTMYARSAPIRRLQDILKNPLFDHNDEVAVGRAVDILTQGGRNSIIERKQVEATLSACLNEVEVESYLTEHPAGAKALADKHRIRGVRLIDPHDRHTPLVVQIAERIYDLRCRIVHGKDGGDGRGEPIRPGREAKLLRHDLSLIRFVAQHVLVTSSRPAPWSKQRPPHTYPCTNVQG